MSSSLVAHASVIRRKADRASERTRRPTSGTTVIIKRCHHRQPPHHIRAGGRVSVTWRKRYSYAGYVVACTNTRCLVLYDDGDVAIEVCDQVRSIDGNSLSSDGVNAKFHGTQKRFINTTRHELCTLFQIDDVETEESTLRDAEHLAPANMQEARDLDTARSLLLLSTSFSLLELPASLAD
jgi:hypothetical protein